MRFKKIISLVISSAIVLCTTVVQPLAFTAYSEENISEFSEDVNEAAQQPVIQNDETLDLPTAVAASDEEAAPKRNIVESGKCGPSATWELDDEGTITVSGEGMATKIDDITDRHCVKKAIVESGITVLYQTFYWMTHLEEAVLPDTIIAIGNHAFCDCSVLQKINIPNSVEMFGENAFAYCYGLKSIDIPDSVKEIGAYAFWCCYSLDSLDIPDSVEKIGYTVFYGNALKSIVFPESVKNVVMYSFVWCKSIESATFLNPACVFDEEADNGSNGTDFNQYYKGVIRGYKNSTAEEFAAKYGLPFEAIETPPLTTTADFPSTTVTTSVNSNIIESGKCGTNSTWELDKNGTLTVKGKGVISNFYDMSDKTAVKKVIVCDGILVISDAFRKFKNVTEIVLPDTLLCINNYAFKGCEKLETIHIPDSVLVIGKGAFVHCTSIKSIHLPDTLVSLEMLVFEGCKNLESVNFPPRIEKIGFATFDFTDLKSIVIPSNIKEISEAAFSYCEKLESIEIPDSVKRIGYDAFESCYKLKSIIIPSSVKIIEMETFMYCRGLESIVIPASVERIDNHAFKECRSLESITILNPECQLDDDPALICNDYDYEAGKASFSGTIIGYKNSTAEAYANKYNYTFVALEDPITTTITTETTTSTTETTTATTETTVSTTPTTTTQKVIKFFAPMEKWEHMAIKNYESKNGFAILTSAINDNKDGTYSIVLSDDKGNIVETYVIDPETGKGKDKNGNDVNLPQTGNNSKTNLLALIVSLLLIGFGIISVRYSFIMRRRNDEQ